MKYARTKISASLIAVGFLLSVLALFGQEVKALADDRQGNVKTIDFSITGQGYTPLQLEAIDNPYSYNQRSKAKQILQDKMALDTTSDEGETVYVRHCRQAEEGCEKRIDALVDLIFRAARTEQTDPWLMLSLALYKANFNPFYVTSRGPGGIMGLNPNRHNDIRFLNDEEYRENCRTEADACQQKVVEVGVKRFSESLQACEHDASSSLWHYVANTCRGNTKFSNKVLSFRRQMLREAQQIENVEWCDPPRPICEDTVAPADPLHGLDLDI